MNLKIERYLIAACIASVVGGVVAATAQSLLMWLTDSLGVNAANVSFAVLIAQFFATVPIAVVAAVWLWKLAKEEGRNKWAWMFFGLVFTLPGVAVFYGVAILQRMRNKDG